MHGNRLLGLTLDFLTIHGAGHVQVKGVFNARVQELIVDDEERSVDTSSRGDPRLAQVDLRRRPSDGCVEVPEFHEEFQISRGVVGDPAEPVDVGRAYNFSSGRAFHARHNADVKS